MARELEMKKINQIFSFNKGLEEEDSRVQCLIKNMNINRLVRNSKRNPTKLMNKINILNKINSQPIHSVPAQTPPLSEYPYSNALNKSGIAQSMRSIKCPPLSAACRKRTCSQNPTLGNRSANVSLNSQAFSALSAQNSCYHGIGYENQQNYVKEGSLHNKVNSYQWVKKKPLKPKDYYQLVFSQRKSRAKKKAKAKKIAEKENSADPMNLQVPVYDNPDCGDTQNTGVEKRRVQIKIKSFLPFSGSGPNLANKHLISNSKLNASMNKSPNSRYSTYFNSPREKKSHKTKCRPYSAAAVSPMSLMSRTKTSFVKQENSNEGTMIATEGIPNKAFTKNYNMNVNASSSYNTPHFHIDKNNYGKKSFEKKEGLKNKSILFNTSRKRNVRDSKNLVQNLLYIKNTQIGPNYSSKLLKKGKVSISIPSRTKIDSRFDEDFNITQQSISDGYSTSKFNRTREKNSTRNPGSISKGTNKNMSINTTIENHKGTDTEFDNTITTFENIDIIVATKSTQRTQREKSLENEY
jgi:hypothetical protein